MDKARRYIRSDDADAALPLGIAQTLHPTGSLVEGGETGAKVGRITTVCGRTADKEIAQYSKGPDSSFQRLISLPSDEIRVKVKSLLKEGFN